MKQEYTSHKTSINKSKVPAVFKKVKWIAGTINADIGGGRYDTAIEYLQQFGATNIILDPHNRTVEHNENAKQIICNGKSDTATIANVLNVIKEPQFRQEVIDTVAGCLKPNGKAYFWIYEGDKSGNGKATSCGWQENRRARDYINEISTKLKVVAVKGQMIIAQKEE